MKIRARHVASRLNAIVDQRHCLSDVGWRSSGLGEWMAPAEAVKPREVAIRRHELASALDREGGNPRVSDEIAARARLLA